MSETETSPTDGNAAVSSPAPTTTDTPVSTPQDTGAASTSPPPSDTKSDSTSPSSGDSRQSDREGLLAAVRSVVPDAKTGPPDASGDQEDQGDQDREAAPGDGQGDQEKKSSDQKTGTDEPPLDLNAPDPTEAELKKLRPQTRRRVEQLISQRNLARTELDQLRPEAEQHRQLQGYLNHHQLAPDDVNALLSVGAALRRQDYQGFLDGVTPYVIAAQEALGLRVARDLQTQVEDGTLSEDAAREMTRTRHRAMQAEHRLKEQGAQHQTETQQRNVAAVRTAVDQWEQNI